SDAARISASTGRPTVLGWEGHENQWRSDTAQIAQRKADVQTIYATEDAGEAHALLEQYDVQYVVIGPRERGAYGTAGMRKFAELGEPVFPANATGSGGGQEVIIYQVAAGDEGP
ncbi:MAG: hypothetical protein WD533_01520, partial [Dehalococcoidia bacterium]